MRFSKYFLISGFILLILFSGLVFFLFHYNRTTSVPIVESKTLFSAPEIVTINYISYMLSAKVEMSVFPPVTKPNIHVTGTLISLDNISGGTLSIQVIQAWILNSQKIIYNNKLESQNELGILSFYALFGPEGDIADKVDIVIQLSNLQLIRTKDLQPFVVG